MRSIVARLATPNTGTIRWTGSADDATESTRSSESARLDRTRPFFGFFKPQFGGDHVNQKPGDDDEEVLDHEDEDTEDDDKDDEDFESDDEDESDDDESGDDEDESDDDDEDEKE